MIGNAGSGKSTLAARLAERLDARHVELDALFHLPDWEPRPPDEFRLLVDERVPVDGRWVVDGNYSAVRDIVWGRADTVVWLDPPRSTVMRQLGWRTCRRVVGREERREADTYLATVGAD